MSHDEILEVVKGERDGLEIEFRHVSNHDEWQRKDPSSAFVFDQQKYRVKPGPPREFWLLPPTKGVDEGDLVFSVEKPTNRDFRLFREVQ